MAKRKKDQLTQDSEDLYEALNQLVRVYQFRDRDRICCYDVSVTQCYAIETLVKKGRLRLQTLAEEMFLDKSAKKSNAKKEEPLVVIDNKVETRPLEDIAFEDNDSLVVLKEPLYIINGVEYTEQEVFGPHPTSPYTPLNKQEIETISILQEEKAIEIYGKKGKKGVVVIITKNGKPVSASKKAK